MFLRAAGDAETDILFHGDGRVDGFYRRDQRFWFRGPRLLRFCRSRWRPDNDGDLDIYIANDSTPNTLCRNEEVGLEM